MSDPITAAAAEAAKAGLMWLGTKVYEGSESACSELEQQPILQKAFCLGIRAIAGADEREYKRELQTTVDRIEEILKDVDAKIGAVNDNVNTLLEEMELTKLKIDELVVGEAAYNAIGVIRVCFDDLMRSIKSLPELKKGDDRATRFYAQVLHEDRIADKISTICVALTQQIGGKPCLLRNILDQINAGNKDLLSGYTLYETYVDSILFDLLKGNLMVESAMKYFDTLKDQNINFPPSLPFADTAEWKNKWGDLITELLDHFNTHLEWYVLTRCADQAQGILPFFFPREARTIFWHADVFCSRYLEQYGLRGRVFSMGGQFSGKLTLNDGTAATGRKFEVQLGRKLDYWSATHHETPNVYDKIDFADTWIVHRFHVPAAAPGTKELQISLPYSPPPVQIETLSMPANPAFGSKPAFGSFVEIARAGGGFAFFSGGWVLGDRDEDSSNLDREGNRDIAKAAVHRGLQDFVIRDGAHVAATVRRPEVALSKGGWLHPVADFEGGVGDLAGREPTHLTSSYRSWLQTAKTVTFPAFPDELVHMVVSLAPALPSLGNFPDSGTLNTWLSGAAARPTKPKTGVTEEELSTKQVIAGLNYDPTLSFPAQGCAIETGINLIPIAKDWIWSRSDWPEPCRISLGAASCGSHVVGVFREGEASARATTFVLPGIPANGLQFRFQAYYYLSIETSGLDVTPFATYARGALDNVHFELRPGRLSTWNSPGLDSRIHNPGCRFLAFDYDGIGQSDHVVAYVPGQSFIDAYGSDGGSRIARRLFLWSESGADYVSKAEDRVLAFDYEGSSQSDNLLFHRPSTGRIVVLKNNAGIFSPVHESSIPQPDAADRAIALDYDSTGRLDHLVIYRPGAGRFLMMKRNGTSLATVCNESSSGILAPNRWCDLKHPADRIIAFGGGATGRLDHLVIYRPGAGQIAIFQKYKDGEAFKVVFESSAGINRFDLRSAADRCFAFDYDRSGKLDHLVFYRPGTGTIYIIKKDSDGKFSDVYATGDPGVGIGGYDLRSPADRAFAFDYGRSGQLDHIMFYRPGTNIFSVVGKYDGRTYSQLRPV